MHRPPTLPRVAQGYDTNGEPQGRGDTTTQEGRHISKPQHNPNRAEITFRSICESYGQKMMLPEKFNAEKRRRKAMDELCETLSLIQKKRNVKSSEPFKLPPWGYKRSPRVEVNDEDLQNSKSRIQTEIDSTLCVISKLKQHITANKAVDALALEMGEGIGYMETDKNMGFVSLPIPVIFHLYDVEMMKYTCIGTVVDMNQCTLARLDAEANEALAIMRSHSGKKGVIKDAVDFVERSRTQSTASIPVLRLLVKLHKIHTVPKDLNFPTRPIIPACVSPMGSMSAVLGSVLARVQKRIPWIVENTDYFLQWLRDPSRDIVHTFDFTNLFGNEPVGPTLELLGKAVREAPDWFQDDYVTPFLTMTTTPAKLRKYGLLPERCTLLEVLTAFTVQETVAVITSTSKNVIVSTRDFLAMGVGTVAPLSNITLAYMECSALGQQRCTQGMRRLIDDIAADMTLITKEELYGIYPSYLTLNYGKKNVYLDVAFRRIERGRFYIFPNIKSPCAGIAAYESIHRNTGKNACALSELHRIAKLSQCESVYNAYRERHIQRLRVARFPEHVVRRVMNLTWGQAKCKWGPRPEETDAPFRHIQVMNDYDICIASMLRDTLPCCKFITAWKKNGTLASISKKCLDRFVMLDKDLKAASVSYDLRSMERIARNPGSYQLEHQCTIQSTLLLGAIRVMDMYYGPESKRELWGSRGHSISAISYVNDCLDMVDNINSGLNRCTGATYPHLPINYSDENRKRLGGDGTFDLTTALIESRAITGARMRGVRQLPRAFKRALSVGIPQDIRERIERTRVSTVEAERMSQELRHQAAGMASEVCATLQPPRAPSVLHQRTLNATRGNYIAERRANSTEGVRLQIDKDGMRVMPQGQTAASSLAGSIALSMTRRPLLARTREQGLMERLGTPVVSMPAPRTMLPGQEEEETADPLRQLMDFQNMH